MRTFIDQLLESRHLSSPLPFWKLHLTDNEVNQLVKYINSCFRGRRYSAHFENKTFSRELCLLCGLWWNKKYNGGRQKIREVLSDYKIDITEEEIPQVRTIIQEGIRQLGIRVHQTEFQKRYLDSVYAQGGLPMQLMTNEESKSTFENFLGKLITRLEEIAPVERESHAFALARKFAQQYLNNETLKTSEAVIEFAVEVTNAYFNEDNTFDDYEIIKDMLGHIRKGKYISKKGQLFRAEWYFRISSKNLSLLYRLDGPYELTNRSEDNNSALLSILANGQRVASYFESRDRYVIMPGSMLGRMFACDSPTAILDFKAVRGDGQKLNYQLLNAEPPYLDEPLLLQYNTQQQAYGKHGDGNYACLLPPGWSCDVLPKGTIVTLGDKDFQWVEGLSAGTFGDGTLEFHNAETGENIRVNKSTPDVVASFSPNCEYWIEESSDTLAMNENDISRCFHFYNKNGEILQRRNFLFQYRVQGESDFHEYKSGSLPDGRITMQVCDSDGNTIKTYRFVNLHELRYTKEDDTISLTYQNGACILLSGQEHIEKQSSNTYTVAEAKRSEAIAAANIHFRILSRDSQPLADIAVPSPLRKNGFATLDGRPLANGARIAYDELYKYQAVLTEKRAITIEFKEEIKTYERGKKEYNTILKKCESYRAGSYTLDLFKEIIDRCIAICGFDNHHKHICLRICESLGSSNSINIYRYAYQAHQSKYEEYPAYIGITSGKSREPVTGLRLLAIPLEVCSKESPLYHNNKIVLEERDCKGKYYLPEEYPDEGYSFVVVSDNNCDQGSLLPFTFAPYRDKNDRNLKGDIVRSSELLQAGRDAAWQDLWFYINTIIQYRLPYSTFPLVRAVALHPDLLASMVSRIDSSQLNYDINTIVSELQRMESELGFSFHYVPIECWKQECKNLDDLNILKELLKRQFGDDDSTAIFKRLIGESSDMRIPYNSRNEYYAQANSAVVPFDTFYTPPYLSFLRVELPPNIVWNDCGIKGVIQKLQNLAIVMPQNAAQYAHGADMTLWNYDRAIRCKSFIRRMINYMSIYTPNLYKKLFFIALLREPVTQIKS